MEECAVIIHLFKATAPDELPVMDGDIRAAVTHILSAVLFKINRLDDHEALQIRPPKYIRRVPKNPAKDVPEDSSHLLINEAQRK